MVQQLACSVGPYTMSSVLTFVKVAGRGTLAGPDGTGAGVAATETRTSTTTTTTTTTTSARADQVTEPVAVPGPLPDLGRNRTKVAKKTTTTTTTTTTSAQAAPMSNLMN